MNRLATITAALLLLAPPVFAQAGQEQKPDKKNLVVKEWNTDARSNRQVLDHKTIFNAEGRKIEETEYSSSGQKWRKRFEYGTNGKVCKENLYDAKNRLVSVKKTEYDEFQRKKVQYTYNAKGKLVMTKNFEYIAQDTE
ncbi:MAG: hypothetical protein ILP18_04490 [Treponema sp.]|nr:hypothetical protein [Treponema sp.]